MALVTRPGKVYEMDGTDRNKDFTDDDERYAIEKLSTPEMVFRAHSVRVLHPS